MALLIWFLGLIDILLTDFGLKAGFIKEGNPLMAYLFQANPNLAILFSLTVSGFLLYILHHAKKYSTLASHGLIGLFLVKCGIILLHTNWLFRVFITSK